MRIPRRILLIIAVFLVSIPALSALDLDNREVEQFIHNIRSPLPPKVVGDFLVFSQVPVKYTRYMGVCFAHEAYREIHVFEKNRYGVFFLAYPLSKIPEEMTSVTYRMVADGLWMTDPNVATTVKDNRGVRLSVLALGPREHETHHETQVLGNGYVEFYTRAPAGSTVALIGDFNNWDPFSQIMSEKSPGLYSIKIRTSPGNHTYTYAVNGDLIDVTTIETRPEYRVFVHTLGARALLIRVK